jgi:lysophospholipid acyltransferase (LPLAT)-like uncharacterized protein
MKKYFFLTVLSIFIISSTYADHQLEAYSFNAFGKIEIKGSDNYYQFKSE